MSGPTASVILARQPDPQDLLSRLAVLAGDHSLQNGSDGWTEVFVVTTVPIGGSYAGDARLIDVRWTLEKGVWADEEARSARDRVVSAAFGFEPASSICVNAAANKPADHRILGEIMVHLAQVYQGVVDFDGELIPPLSLHTGERAQVLARLPGQIVAVPYESGNGRVCISHIGNREFMAAWLAHPDFHMIK